MTQAIPSPSSAAQTGAWKPIILGAKDLRTWSLPLPSPTQAQGFHRHCAQRAGPGGQLGMGQVAQVLFPKVQVGS